MRVMVLRIESHEFFIYMIVCGAGACETGSGTESYKTLLLLQHDLVFDTYGDQCCIFTRSEIIEETDYHD
jgi:hypothetical protein